MKTITETHYIVLQEYKRRTKELFKEINKLVTAAEKLVGDKDDYIFDCFWNDFSLRETLKKMDIKVKKD